MAEDFLKKAEQLLRPATNDPGERFVSKPEDFGLTEKKRERHPVPSGGADNAKRDNAKRDK